MIPEEYKANKLATAKVSKTEHEAITSHAKDMGQTLSAWLRKIALKAMKEEKEKKV